jgi:hypothetical protein
MYLPPLSSMAFCEPPGHHERVLAHLSSRRKRTLVLNKHTSPRRLRLRRPRLTKHSQMSPRRHQRRARRLPGSSVQSSYLLDPNLRSQRLNRGRLRVPAPETFRFKRALQRRQTAADPHALFPARTTLLRQIDACAAAPATFFATLPNPDAAVDPSPCRSQDDMLRGED